MANKNKPQKTKISCRKQKLVAGNKNEPPWYSRLCFFQTRSAWSMDQGSTRKCSAVHNFGPTVTEFCVMWEGLSLPHDTKFRNCRGEIVDRWRIFIWSLIHRSGWSGLIKAEPGLQYASPFFLNFCVLSFTSHIEKVNNDFLTNLFW